VVQYLPIKHKVQTPVQPKKKKKKDKSNETHMHGAMSTEIRAKILDSNANRTTDYADDLQ
jgi:polysaccharide deacetylase 2 family uncharacterized protein YibQ